MQTYQIIIEYDGNKFVGWQIQKNGISIQETIQKAFKKLTKKNIIIYGSGRTDAGVHAIAQSAHFRTDYKIDHKINFIKSINFFLIKYEISILDIKKKNKNFHARYSAKKRIYKYLIINRYGKLALKKNKAWNIRKKLDLELMKKSAVILKGTRDFSTFRASSCNSKSPIKTLENVSIKKSKNLIELTFVSQSFLQQQVRSMVGCIKYVGEKKWTLKNFKTAMLSKDRTRCAPPAPAIGLYLYKVKY